MYTRINPQIGDLLKAIDHIFHPMPQKKHTPLFILSYGPEYVF